MKKLTIITASLILTMPFIAAAESIPSFPMSFWGNVSINNSSAAAGSVVRAYYGSTLAGQVVVSEAGIYGYTEPAKQKLVVGEGSGPINFTIQSGTINSGNETAGTSIQSYGGFSSGVTVQQNFNFIIAPASSGSSSSGGSGGGGGGGGGGTSVSSPTPSSTSHGSNGDATGDGSVNILDFNSLMINWGKTGPGNAADFNGDGKVDIFDFNILMINWSK